MTSSDYFNDEKQGMVGELELTRWLFLTIIIKSWLETRQQQLYKTQQRIFCPPRKFCQIVF